MCGSLLRMTLLSLRLSLRSAMESIAPLAMAVPFRTTNGFSRKGSVAVVNCGNSGPAWLPLVVEVWFAICVAGSPFAFLLGGEVAGPGELGVLFAVENISWARPTKRMESWSCARTQWITSKTKHIHPWGKRVATAEYAVGSISLWHQVLVDLKFGMLNDRGHLTHTHTIPDPHARH